jgi:hypothetical protein
MICCVSGEDEEEGFAIYILVVVTRLGRILADVLCGCFGEAVVALVGSNVSSETRDVHLEYLVR